MVGADPLWDDEARIDRYHDGYAARLAGAPCPEDGDAAEGWRDAERASKVHVLKPARRLALEFA